ncbi:RNA-binding protein MEX3D [Microcaecilia unicolor]|uniref:RNA-binding protein MEX3D n=1 Tax=Microcaecilia unicolor TaxID=1415580 RepID=A0A6P7ZMD2_9AMPH|nr:RNA-binding protein MEX3D [Microcaecilia unicolor]
MPSSIYQPEGETGCAGLETAGEQQPPPEQEQGEQPPPPSLEPPPEGGEEEEQQQPPPDDEAFKLALDQLSILGLEEGVNEAEEAGQQREEEEEAEADEEQEGDRDLGSTGGGGLLTGLHMLEPSGGSSPGAAPDLFASFPQLSHSLLAEQLSIIGSRKKSVNMTECVPVPSSEHVAEIVGRQGCKIKALRAKTNTYIKTPVRGEEPIFIVTGRKEDVEMAKREILSAAEHFSMIRATRNKVNGLTGAIQGPPNLPGQTTIQVRVPYRVVGLVVGPKGATIKRIQQTTHTYIVTPSRDKEPVFEVTGMPENVDRAREEIEAHITMRTGSFIDMNTDNDFHSNGTDVCLDLLGNTASLWAKAPNPARRPSCSLRNDSLSSLGSTSTESYYSSRVADASPSSPFSTNSSGGGAGSGGSSGFTFNDSHTTPLSTEECEFGFEFLALDLTTPTTIWSPFERANPLQTFSSCSAINGTQRRNSSISGTGTPRHSPTLPETGIALDHPLARRIHSDPVNTLSWLPTQGSLSSFSNSTGYSSSSSLPGSISAASGSPTDSSSSADGHRKSTRDCMVCFESEVIAALVPCGHNLFCMECAIRICERATPECPACHTPATQAIRIFS